MEAYIKALSYYLPQETLTNEKLSEMFPEWDASKISSKVGIEERHIASEDETALDMAVKAAENLFSEYENISRDSIDFVLLCTQSPDYHLPSSSCIIQDKLKLPKSSGALDYNLGCSGAIYGLALAKGLIVAGIAQNVLVLTTETYTKYIHESDKSNRSIFGDGAAACIVSNQGFAKIGNFALGTDGSGFQDLIVATGCARNPQKTGKYIEDDDGHLRRDDYLYMNGSTIFNFTMNVVPELIKNVIEKNKLERDDISWFVMHQANKFMLNTIRKLCLIPKDKYYINLSDKGNTVSSTIFIALKEMITDGMIQQDSNVLCAGFGVGLSWGAVILYFEKL